MGAPKTTKFGANMYLADKEYVDEIFYRKMVQLIGFCWFCITTTLVFFIRFIARHVFRIKGEDSSYKRISSDEDDLTLLKELRGLESVTEANRLEDTSSEFKFRFEVPEALTRIKDEEETRKDHDAEALTRIKGEEETRKDDDAEALTRENDEEETRKDDDAEALSSIKDEEESRKDDASSSTTTKISKYSLLSQKDFSGFIQKPEDITACVEVSYVSSDRQFLEDTEKLDRELKTRLLSVKGLRQFNLTEEAVQKEEDPIPVNSHVLTTANKSEDSEPIISFKNQLSSKARHLDSKISLLGERDAANGVCFGNDPLKFDSDSESTSTSDGYSVKELIADFDSDGFLSESDFGSHECKSGTTKSTYMDSDEENPELFNDTKMFEEKHLQNLIESSMIFSKEYVELLQDIQNSKGAFLKNSSNSHTESLDSVDWSSHLKDTTNYSNQCDFSKAEGGHEQFLEQEKIPKGTHLQKTCLSSPALMNLETKMNSFSIMKPTNSLKYLNNDLPDDDAYKPVCTEEKIVGKELEATKSCNSSKLEYSCSLDNKFLDFGKDRFSSFKQNNKVKHVEEVLAEKGLEEPLLEPIESGEEESKVMDNGRKFRGIDICNSPIPNGFSSSCNCSQQNEAVMIGENLDSLRSLPDDFNVKETEHHNIQKTEERHINKSLDLAMEDSDELESLWEHQDLIEQLKMEIKNVRSVGLPTILEESESPKVIDDLKPFKIDGKFLNEDPIDELQKFYKSYRERMRKFDILNYQKMYAIGFLQVKDPLQSMGSQKLVIPTVTSLLYQSLWSCRPRKSDTDPSKKFIKELQNDLEMVYVGQLCLSWEFLHWQYEKSQELQESDPYKSHQYNHVAGEFQQFQVLMRRFLENESFQGSRVPNYVRNRCVLRNLLQVPVIKEDCLKEKMKERRNGNGTITIEILEDIMKESIGIFWEFVKADKDEIPMIVKGLMRAQVELQDPVDLELMEDIQANLQKKDKKLKDQLKTGNCLVKKFKKPQEDRSNQDLFFSQIELKLVSRVLKMSRLTTDQLVWCHKKLNKITFVGRKLHREPSFLLFPC